MNDGIDPHSAGQRYQRHARRDSHGVVVTIVLFFLTMLFFDFLGVKAHDYGPFMGNLAYFAALLLSLLAAKGFWHWFMASRFIDRLYNDYPDPPSTKP